MENLPEGLFTDDERVYFGQGDERLQPMDEEELDRLLSVASQENLVERYETNEDGEVIIDEFECFDGNVDMVDRCCSLFIVVMLFDDLLLLRLWGRILIRFSTY